jgi:hypothetical protein
MPTNPYMPSNSRKAVPPPAPPAATKEKVRRKDRMGLDTFTYSCHSCNARHSHSSGYMFIVMLDGERLYFCDHNCCDAFEKGYTKPGIGSHPTPDRRGAIAATRAKNEEND